MSVKRGHLMVTKYHGPTERRMHALISARSFSKKVIVHWNNALDVQANHDAAVMALCADLGFDSPSLVRAEKHDSTGYVYVREV